MKVRLVRIAVNSDGSFDLPEKVIGYEIDEVGYQKRPAVEIVAPPTIVHVEVYPSTPDDEAWMAKAVWIIQEEESHG